MRFVYFLLCIVGGVCLYWLQKHSRLSYGLLQLAVAVLLLVLWCFPIGIGFLMVGGEGVIGDLLSNAVTLFAGLYAMVQGLGNVIGAVREPSL
jgi:hypothetical protein